MMNTLRSWVNSLKSLVVANTTRHLLTLPPEIRNQIYQLVLVSEENIEISAARQISIPEEPGLLRTCCQIRNEARPMYFLQNSFTFSVHNWDATLLLKWAQVSPLHRATRILYTANLVSHKESWENLMVWLETCAEGRCHWWPAITVSQHPNARIPRLIASLANQLNADGVRWFQIWYALEQSRKMIALFAPEWRWDEE